ncbi:MAG: hypothetical protein R6U21_01925 [Thermoplasmatota archaeon]
MIQEKKIKISVAILADEPLGWGSGKHYFPVILDNYTWKKDGVIYEFKTEYIHDKDILAGKLNTSTYQVLLAPGGGVGDGHAVMKAFTFSRKVRKWKKKIKAFIKQGGGYVGICGGTALFTGLSTGKQPRFQTFLEKAYHKSSFHIGTVNSYYHHLAFPLLFPFQYNYPHHIGATGYVFSFAPGETKQGTRLHTGGVPLDFTIDNSHPIFSDIGEKLVRMRWWGGPALDILSSDQHAATPIAWYPTDDFSTQNKTGIKAWRYTGGATGLIKALFQAAFFIKKQEKSLKDLLMYTYFFAGDWEKTNHFLDLQFNGKPAIAVETYPNEKQAQIVLCTAHPEYMIWWDGHIEEVDGNQFHCLAYGLHQWRDIELSKAKLIDQLTYTWWLVRRMTAWAAKISAGHLPPIEKEEKNEGIKTILNKNIFWDETIEDQIQNI